MDTANQRIGCSRLVDSLHGTGDRPFQYCGWTRSVGTMFKTMVETRTFVGIGVLFGCFGRKIDGDPWFTWFNHPGISMYFQPKRTPMFVGICRGIDSFQGFSTWRCPRHPTSTPPQPPAHLRSPLHPPPSASPPWFLAETHFPSPFWRFGGGSVGGGSIVFYDPWPWPEIHPPKHLTIRVGGLTRRRLTRVMRSIPTSPEDFRPEHFRQSLGGSLRRQVGHNQHSLR